MNCQETRKAIDSGIGRESLSGEAALHVDLCASCRRHAQEMRSLMALLHSQPRVEVPGDFDFRLKARIARAEREQHQRAASVPAIGGEFFTKLWSGAFSSFSWSQATAAMAALALVVGISTYQIYRHSENVPQSATPAVVVRVDAPAQIKSAPSVAMTESRNTRVAAEAAGVRAAREMAVSAPVETEESEIGGDWRGYNHERSQMVSASQQMTLIGAEVASQVSGKAPAYVPSI